MTFLAHMAAIQKATQAAKARTGGHTLVPYRGKPASDGPRYKAIGNSWAVNCARWIGQRIAIVDGLAASNEEQFHA